MTAARKRASARKRTPTKATRRRRSRKKAEPVTEVVGGPECPTYYTNHVQLRVSHGDFRFSFQEVLEADEKKMIVKELARVYLSPVQMKAVRQLVDRQLDLYESQYGEIVDVAALAETV